MHRPGKNNLLALGDKYRIYILFVAVFVFMSLFAPRFFNAFNFTTILNAIAMNATVAIGFSVVMICGQLDLSIGSVITFAGALTMGLQPFLGFTGSVIVAVPITALYAFMQKYLIHGLSEGAAKY